MSGFGEVARRVVDKAVNDGRFDGLPESRLEELEAELAGELAEAAEPLP